MRHRGDGLVETLAVFDRTDRTPLTTSEVAADLECTHRAAYDRLRKLADDGTIETKKVGARGRIWWLAPEESGGDVTHSQFECLVESVREYAIFLLDVDGHVRTWNSGAERIKGYEQSEILGQSFETFYTEADREAGIPERLLARAAETGSVEHEGWRVRADGTRFWASVTITALYEDGILTGYAKVTQDATEQHSTRERLKHDQQSLSEELDRLFERVDDGVLVVGRDWHCTYVNERLASIVDTPREALVERRLWEVLPGGDDTEFRTTVEAAMADRETTTFELAPRHRDGVYEVRVYPTEEGLSMYVRDITERVERERDLARYETIVETIDDGIYVVDQDGRITLVNDAYASMVGQSRADLVGSHVSTVVADDEILHEAERLERELLAGERETATLEAELEDADGRPWFGEATFSLLRDDEGYQRIGVVREVTDRVEYERELERTTDLLGHTERLAGVGGWELSTEPPHEVVWTDQLFDIFGVEPRAPLVPEAVLSFVHPDDRERVERETDRLLTEGERMQQEYRIVTDEGEVRWLQVVSERPADREDVVRGATMDVTARKRYERELERQREHLVALNNLGEVVQGITEAVVEQSSREAIEQTLCTRLADSDSYEYAWVGGTDATNEALAVRATAGTDGERLDTGAASLAATAVSTGEMQVGSGRDRSSSGDRPSRAAIPIAHEEVCYGVFVVGSDRTAAFGTEERAVIGGLGEVVGHAIAAIERKRALMGDELVELTLGTRNSYDSLGIDVPEDGRITFDRAVPVDGECFLLYGTATDNAVAAVEAMETTLPHWERFEWLDEDGSPRHFQAHLSEAPATSVAAAHGGDVVSAVVEGDRFELTVHLPPGVDVRQLTDAVREHYPTLELHSRHQLEQANDPEGVHAELAELTDRQRAALETAYFGGYFDSHRRRSGSTLAADLGISPSTFHRHLRTAERAVLEAVFAET